MTTLNPRSSSCSFESMTSSAVVSAEAGRTRPSVSPAARRFGLMIRRDDVAARTAGVEIVAVAAATERRRAKLRRSIIDRDCLLRAGQRAREPGVHRVGPLLAARE